MTKGVLKAAKGFVMPDLGPEELPPVAQELSRKVSKSITRPIRDRQETQEQKAARKKRNQENKRLRAMWQKGELKEFPTKTLGRKP